MREEEENDPFIYFDGQLCFFGETLLQPLVCVDGDPKTAKEKGFNTITIAVHLLTSADLDFEQAFSMAQDAEERGLKIVFDLDLGLFDRLNMPLESDALFSTLTFAIETFRTVLLEPFSSITLGVIAYKGTADFYRFLKNDFSLFESLSLWVSSSYGKALDLSHLEKTDEERMILIQAYFEMGIQFIERITDPLPAKFPVFVLLDFSEIQSFALKAFMLNRERLGRVLFVPKDSHSLYYGMSWESVVEAPFAFFGSTYPERLEERGTYGLMLPSLEKKELLEYKEIGEVIDFFIRRNLSFRMIPEALFVSEWDDVELLFVPKNLSKLALRMVKGYLASQGDLVVLGAMPEIPEALEFNEWKKGLI